MAGEMTKDITKVNVTLTASNGKRRTLTSLYDYKFSFPEKVEKRDPDLKGNTYIRKKEDKSGELTIEVKAGTQDERFLDMLANNTLSSDIVVIDESASLNSKQYSCKECYIKKIPDDNVRDVDNRGYEFIISEVKLEQL